MMNDLNNKQAEIFDYYQTHTLKETCKQFNLKEHQLHCIINKKKKLNSTNQEDRFALVKIVDETSDELTANINGAALTASVETIRKILGIGRD